MKVVWYENSLGCRGVYSVHRMSDSASKITASIKSAKEQYPDCRIHSETVSSGWLYATKSTLMNAKKVAEKFDIGKSIAEIQVELSWIQTLILLQPLQMTG